MSRLYVPYLCVVPAYDKKAKPTELDMDEDKLAAMSAMAPLAKAKIAIAALSSDPDKLDAYMEEWANRGILNKAEFAEVRLPRRGARRRQGRGGSRDGRDLRDRAAQAPHAAPQDGGLRG